MLVFIRKEEKKNLYVCPACAATIAITEPEEVPTIRPEVCVNCGEDLDWTEIERRAKA